MSEPISAGPCLTCKTPIWMERAVYDTYLQTCANFHCVHGHTQHFVRGKSEAQKLRDQLDAERRRRESAEQNIEYQSQMRKSAERSAIAYKGQATKLRNRAKAGVCPCCKRTVSQLARHMASKHPDFSTNPDGDLPKDVALVLSLVEGGKA